ncbi:NAD-dependent epimerase/dehydratase family protein [Glutamicibacter arilaitensis]|uniref:NAD-dependent epimerase/dehydratase family protein n=1 Tax=Glutamicibacter arilaitensis TaxID=256701 RepID=UPI00384C7D6F
MKILLISCGDVATEAGLRFEAAGHQVTAWRRKSSKLPSSFTGHSVDLLESGSWPAIDPETDIVLFTPVPATRDVDGYNRGYLQVANRLAESLAASCPSLQRLIYVSSSAVTGGTEGQWANESSPLAPARPTSQVLADTELLLAGSGLPLTILRASGIYGPGRTRLIDLVRNGSARLPRTSHWTNRIHRDDLASAIVHVATLGDEAEDLYLATDSEPAQLADVYRFLSEALAIESPESEADAEEPRRTADRRLNNARLLASGFIPRFPSYREGYRSILAGESTRHE